MGKFDQVIERASKVKDAALLASPYFPTVKYENGDGDKGDYTGQMQNGKPYGLGVFKDYNSTTYVETHNSET